MNLGEDKMQSLAGNLFLDNNISKMAPKSVRKTFLGCKAGNRLGEDLYECLRGVDK